MLMLMHYLSTVTSVDGMKKKTETKDRRTDKQQNCIECVAAESVKRWLICLFLHVFNPSTYHSHNPLTWNMDYAACYQWFLKNKNQIHQYLFYFFPTQPYEMELHLNAQHS